MSVEVDLHLHTTLSDGTLSPEKIVQRAVHNGLNSIAITDHDTTSGLGVSKEIANSYGINFIPGIEIGTKLNGEEIHILGYYVEENDEELQQVLKELRRERLARGERIVSILNGLGLDISWQRVLEIASGGSAGRPHVARALVERGYAKDVKDAFDTIIGLNGPAYVERRLMTPKEAIRLIVRNGALPILAHPLDSKFKSGRRAISNLEKVIPVLLSYGLVGLEAYYGDYSKTQVDRLVRFAKFYDIVATGGSDYHGVGGIGEPQIGQSGPMESVIAELESLRRS
jgi:predicted metal-dependent phosphoesterase TrpH